MSAWIVSEAHIALLVASVFRYEVPLPRSIMPDELGYMLWHENHRSINYRYDETNATKE